jgi:hypothetical protein
MHTARTTIPLLAMVFTLAFARASSAQTVIPLWDGGAPGFEALQAVAP